LRITRWVTLCRRVRDSAGRHRGTIYALHEEPFSLAGTFDLDAQYMAFLNDTAEQHHHAHVRAVACAMRDSLTEPIAAGDDVCEADALAQISQRIDAIATVSGLGTGDYFGFRHSSLAQLRAWQVSRRGLASNANRRGHARRVQNLNPDRVQKSNSALCSSSNYNYKKTTTTSGSKPDKNLNTPFADSDPSRLQYPECLSANEQALAWMYLANIDPALRQPVLDELAGTIHRQSNSAHRVRNPIGLLCWMCNEARAGKPPLTSDSVRAAERRRREHGLAAYDAAKRRELTEQAKAMLATKALTTEGDVATTPD